MLAQTVRSNLKDINNLKMRTKTMKFSNLFQSVPTVGNEEAEVRQVLMKDGLIELTEDDLPYELVVEDDELESDKSDDIEIVEEGDELYEIVDNPDELVVQFPIISDINLEEKLPFFKSLSLKLASL